MKERTGPGWDSQPFYDGDMVISKDFDHLWGDVLNARQWGDLTVRWGDGTITGERAHHLRLMTPLEALARA